MAGTVARTTQTVPVSTPASQAVGVSSASTGNTGWDSAEIPPVILVDENNPGRKVVPDGVSTTGINAASNIPVVITTPVQVRATTLNRQVLTIYNLGATDCYIGNSSVSGATNGLLLKAGAAMDIKSTLQIYAVTAAGSTTLAYWEEVS